MAAGERWLIQLEDSVILSIDGDLASQLMEKLTEEMDLISEYSAVAEEWSSKIAKTEEDRERARVLSNIFSASLELTTPILKFFSVPEGAVADRCVTVDEHDIFADWEAHASERLNILHTTVRDEIDDMKRQVAEGILRRPAQRAAANPPTTRPASSLVPVPTAPLVQNTVTPPNFGPRCYRCGQRCGDDVHRRTVTTGSDQRVSVGRSLRVSSGSRSGLRTVCGSCAAALDSAQTGSLTTYLIGGVILIIAVAALLLV